MIIEDLTPQPQTKVLFKLASFKSVPKESGCYVLTTFENNILYVGLAKNLNNRFMQHLENPEKTNPTVKGKVVWFYFLNYDEKNLEKLERTWINQYLTIEGQLPLLNKVNSPVS
ncbi:MAG: GIY-YIG nuclease family protein [Pyrinomonadaceae bacterium]|nr:GIY-YIG nuclease family protein [Pyrinomonadaceae bacterium]